MATFHAEFAFRQFEDHFPHGYHNCREWLDDRVGIVYRTWYKRVRWTKKGPTVQERYLQLQLLIGKTCLEKSKGERTNDRQVTKKTKRPQSKVINIVIRAYEIFV